MNYILRHNSNHLVELAINLSDFLQQEGMKDEQLSEKQVDVKTWFRDGRRCNRLYIYLFRCVSLVKHEIEVVYSF